MTYLIINFKNKSSLYTFSRILKNFSIGHNIINTPHQISRGCSLSISIEYSYKSSVINILKVTPTVDISGIFALEKYGFGERIKRLYWLYFIFLILYNYDESWKNSFLF